jgi:hypothetical protein
MPNFYSATRNDFGLRKPKGELDFRKHLSKNKRRASVGALPRGAKFFRQNQRERNVRSSGDARQRKIFAMPK